VLDETIADPRQEGIKSPMDMACTRARPNRRLLLPGRLPSGSRALSSAFEAARLPPHAPQQKRAPLDGSTKHVGGCMLDRISPLPSSIAATLAPFGLLSRPASNGINEPGVERLTVSTW
jgi:hypothetical protein